MIDDEANRALLIAARWQEALDSFVSDNAAILTRADASDALLTVAISNVARERGILSAAESLTSALRLLEDMAERAIGKPRLVAKDGMQLN